MARYKAGEAEALIVPSLDGFGRKLRAAFEAMPDAEYMVDVLPDLGGFPARLEAELAKLDAEVAVDIVPDLDGFYAQLETALTDQSITVEVEADTAAAEAQIAATAAARRAEIQAEADTAAAEARLAELTAQRDAEIQVELDESSAAGVAARMAMLARDREIDMNVDLDTAAATAKLALLGVQAAMVTGAIGAGLGGVVGLLGVAAGAVGGLGIGFMGLGTAALPIIGAIALGTDGIKQAAQEAAPAFTSLKDSISGVFGEEMKAGFQDISGILEGITPGMEGVASGLSGMFNSTFELIRNDGMGEINTLLAGIPPMLSQLQPGLDTMLMGFLNLGEAAGPALGSIGAGLGEMLGAIGGAFTQMQDMGILTTIFNETGNALAGVGAGVGDLLVALGQIGATVLPVVEPLFRSLGTAFLNMAPGLASAGAALGTALGPVLEQVGTTIGGIGTQLAPLLPLLGQFVTALLQGIGPLLPILSTLGQTLLGALTPVLPVLSQVLQVVGGALAEAFQAIAPALLPLATAAGQVISALAPILPLAGQLIASLATELAPAISGIATALGPVIASLASAFMPVLAALTPTLTMLGQMIGQVAGQIGGVLVQAVTMLAPFLPQIAAAFMQILQAVMPLIPQLIQLVVTGLMGMLPVLIQLMPTFVRFINILAQVVGVVAQVLGVFIQVVQWLGTLTAAIVGFVTGNGEQLRQFWEGVKAGFSEMIGNVVSAVAGWASAMSAQLGAMASAAIAQVVNWWNGMTARVAEGVQNVVSRVGEIPGKITGFFADAGQWLYNAGKDVVTGLINGLTDMLGEAYNRVRDMAGNIADVARDALGIASPSRVFMEIGGYVSEGLALGIEQSARQPSDSISDTVGGIVGTAASTVADGVRRTANSTVPRARPGLFTGVGGPRDDANLVRVSDREFIVNAEATDQWRPFLDAINFGGLIPGFADGGQPGGPRAKVNESSLVNFARGLEGQPYVWGGVNWGDCCLVGETAVWGPNGTKPISELQPGDYVYSYEDGKLTSNKVTAQWFSKRQETYKVRTRRRGVVGSDNHPFLRLVMGEPATHVKGGARGEQVPATYVAQWARLDALKPGDLLVQPKDVKLDKVSNTLPSGREVGLNEAWLLGLIMGDGSVQDTKIELCVYGDLRVRAAGVFAKMGITTHDSDSHGVRAFSTEFARELAEAGFRKPAHEKHIPDCVWGWDEDRQRAFLNGYCDADGHHPADVARHGERTVSSCSRRLIEDARFLHIVLGDPVTNVTTNHRLKTIHINGVEVKNARPLHTFGVSAKHDTRGGISADLRRAGIAEWVDSGDFTLARVIDITPQGEQDTYDIEVEGAHNFIANGVVVHNSGAMSAIARFATGLDPFGGRFATGNEGEALRGMGFEQGRWQKGYFGIGWTNDPGGPGGGHTAGTLSEGTNVEMGGARGNGQFGGGAAGANDGQFRNQMRIRVKDPFKPNVPGRVGLSGTSDPSIDVTADGFTPSTADMTSGVSASATPSSWSDFAGDMASVAAKSATSDLLGIFGIEDEMPWWMQVHQAMSATPLQDGQAPTPIADTPDEVLADPTLAATVALNPMPEPPKSEGSNHIWDPAQGAEQWRPMVRAAMKRQGKSSKAEEDAWIRQIQSESGGNPGIKQGIIDVNSGGNEAVGLLQIIPGTFAAHRDPELPNDRRNAWANINAAIRYGHARYGAGLLDAIGDGDGYKDGGLIPGLGGVRQDSIGIKVSPGEYVSHAVATAANLPLFEALNADPYLLHNIPRAISAVPTTGAGGGIDASITVGTIQTTDWSAAQRTLAREQGRQVRNLSMAGSVTG